MQDKITFGMGNQLRFGIAANVFPIERLFYNHLNATEVGNIAYVALYHPDENSRAYALKLLNDCFEEHKERLESKNQN